MKHGRITSAANLAVRGCDALITAVAVSEQGWPAPDGLGAIPSANPLHATLTGLRTLLPQPGLLRANGTTPPLPDLQQLRQALDQGDAILSGIVSRFEIDLEGDGPARTVRKLRPEPTPVPAVVQQPVPKPVRVAVAATTPKPVPEGHIVPGGAVIAPKTAGGVASAAFWSLIDAWGVDDTTALRLVGYDGGLTKKGTRPRFKLDAEQGERLAALRQIDTSLRALGLDPRLWLVARLRATPFKGATPLAQLAEGNAKDVRRYVLQQGLQISAARPT